MREDHRVEGHVGSVADMNAARVGEIEPRAQRHAYVLADIHAEHPR